MKREIVEKYIRDMDQIALTSVKKGKFNRAMTVLHTMAELQYEWNQNYVDETAESIIQCLANQNLKLVADDFKPRKQTILFYDNFGLDTRGLALIYTKAICELGYHLIYVVPKQARENQPEIHRNTAQGNITFCYIDHKRGLAKVSEIIDVFNKYMPAQAFFYTDPEDVEGCVGFGCMKDKVVRYQVNLTDHAFWLGKSVFDYCIEFREYGACVSNKYRKIDAAKLVLLPYYPYIDKKISFSGFDFDTKGKKVLFSGGALYKTISDDHLYYNIVKELLERHDDLVFLYAGAGDDTELKELERHYNGRVMHIAERKDLYEVMRHVTLYLNTYPMIGGLMTQYAASAGCVPLTLVKTVDCSLDGLLINHTELKVEFYDMGDLLEEADHLLLEDSYRQHRGKDVEASVLTEEEFQHAVAELLNNRTTGYDYILRDIDTTAFRSTYDYRFTEERLVHGVVKWKQPFIWRKYPGMLLQRLYYKLKS